MKKAFIGIAAIVALLLIGAVVYLGTNLKKAQDEKNEIQELMEMDRLEMENEYRGFTQQYDELKNTIQNDTLAQQLTAERQRAQQLLEELQRVKNDDYKEITRLRKELAEVRAVMRHYIQQIDSLQRINQALVAENTEVKEKYNAATSQISSLNTEREQLKETVSIASQLNATGISVTPRNKRNKEAKKVKDVTSLIVNFNIARNPTAKTGGRNAYIRIMKPDNTPLTNGETCKYENKNIEVSIKKYIEYDGEELAVSGIWQVQEYLQAGTYRVSIFVDERMIGSSSFTLN
ncbi:MAG: hypothetical protein MJZ83_11730 [Bacteroidaceae bacterium]|nr:hypothetical protein [Bacteroidaceae bacterium]